MVQSAEPIKKETLQKIYLFIFFLKYGGQKDQICGKTFSSLNLFFIA